ncbi:hypothetical protein JL722_385 [Aureococcus anophagefferens]|nr:hypothetical protein JL722_385 [Aureococcus anophagefferens]
MASANPDAPAADDADGDDASATFSFDDDEDAALAAVVDDLAMEPDEHRVPSVAELEKRFGAEFVANLRSPDELIAEAVLRNAGGAPDEALACAAAAVRTHDLCGAADERFRFACHDRRLGVQMMAVFLRVKAPASSARWELLARVKSGLGAARRAAPAVPRAQGAGKIQDALADAQTVVDAGGDAAARRAATALRDELASLARTNAPTLRVPEDFGTFSAACAAAEASSTGALIVLAPRKYDEAASLRGCAAGELRVVVDGDAHAEVRALKVSGARVSLDRILVTGGAAVAETAGAVTFRRCILSNGNGAALETRGADVALESSVVEHARDGVLVHGGGFRLSGSTVQYCYCDGVSRARVVVEDVVIKDCGGRGLTSTVRFDPSCGAAPTTSRRTRSSTRPTASARQRRAAADPAALRQREVDEARHGLRTAADEPESLMAALEGAIAAGIPADDADMARARRDLQRHAARRDDDDDDAAAGELPGVLPEPQVPRL